MTLLIVIIIGLADYISGEELSFSIFYLIPIAFLSLYKGTKAFSILTCSIFAAIIWFFADYFSREYSNLFFPIWNAFVRLFIFLAIGLLLLYLKEKNKKLNINNSRLEALNEEKNKILGIAAHDLRTPISSIYSLSDLLIEEAENDDKPKSVELLNLIKSMSINFLAVLENLLDISKIESGKVELKLIQQDYIVFIKQQIVFNQILARNKNIKISLQSKIDNLMVSYDSHYLGEVIDNLLSNAIKYSYIDSEIIVRVSLPDSDHLLTEIIDTGKGIPEEEQHKLFNFFQTTSTQPTSGEKSTGLGLAIVKRIVTLHEGKIGINSIPDKGSNFYFALPIKQYNDEI